MPNWCYTNVCFRGKVNNIQRLYDDIEKAVKWCNDNDYNYTNMSYFLSLNGFDTSSYLKRYYDETEGFYTSQINFRGSIFGASIDYINKDTDEAKLYAMLEMAWFTYYEVVQIIASIYNVEVCAYSEECGYHVFTRYENGNIGEYNYDVVVCPESDQTGIYMRDNVSDEVYNRPFSFHDEKEYKEYVDFLNKNSISFNPIAVDKYSKDDLNIYGVYYCDL